MDIFEKKQLPPYLSLDEAIESLGAIIETQGSRAASLVMQTSELRTYTHVTFVLAKASARSVTESVSRSGRPVVVARATPEPDLKLTLGAGLHLLKSLRDEAGTGDIPFVADEDGQRGFQFCEFYSSRSTASNVLRRASQGGQQTGLVFFGGPLRD
jgi:hypothetical protein